MSMPFTKFLVCVLILAVTMGCGTKKNLYSHEGFVEVNGGRIWYRASGAGDNTPLLVLHGGPSFPSYYLDPLHPVSDERPVIFFDQLGCGRSVRITDTPLVNVSAPIDQIARLLAFLDADQFYLAGDASGSMLDMDYSLRHRDDPKAWVLPGPSLDATRWVAE